MHSGHFPAVAAVAAWLLAASCASAPQPQRPGGLMAGNEHTAILLDHALGPILQLEAQQGYRDGETGAFIAQTLLQNRTLEMVELECRTLFKNAEGATIETSAWKEVTLMPASKAMVMAPSLRPDAVRFLTQIRRKSMGPPGLEPGTKGL